MKYIHFIVLVVIGCSMFACKPKSDKNKDKPPVAVDILIAKPVSFPLTVEVNGSVLSEEMIELHPEISGRITYLNMPDGADVTAGTLLAKINDADLQAQLQQQQAQLELATKTEQRLKKLLEVNGVNQSDYDVAVNQVNTYTANVNVLRAQLDKTVIKASFNGKLGLRMVSVGAYVTPQTIMGTLQQTDKMKIDFTVPESSASLVAVGNTITVQANGSTEKLFAVVSAVEPQINIDSRNFKVRARLKSGTLAPGAFVKVLLSKDSQGIVVPSNAIIPDASSNQVVLVENNKSVFVDVETGIRNADAVEIVSGINPGDSIVISGVLFVRPNTDVKIKSVK